MGINPCNLCRVPMAGPRGGRYAKRDALNQSITAIAPFIIEK